MSVRISHLPNGLTVATDTMAEAQSVALGVWVGVGTRDEPAAAQGVAHLVEHMLFKGTPRRDAIAIAEAIEGTGGYMNAYTSREETAYYVRVLPEHVELAADVLADMIQHSLLDETELARERDVIIQEIGQYYDAPDEYIFDVAQDVAFPGQGLGWSILGQTDNIAAMPRASLRAYLDSHYTAGNMLFLAAGAIAHDSLLALAKKLFTELPRGGKPARRPAQYQGGSRFEPRELEQNHLLIGFKAPGYHEEDYATAQVLAMLLGGGSSSRLFQEVREKRGLAYHVSANGQAYSDIGTLLLYAGTSPEKAGELQDVIWQELARLPRDLTQAECDRAKAQLRAGLIMSQDAPSARLDQLAAGLLIWQREVPLAEKLGKLARVTPDAIAALAGQLTQPAATIVGLGTA